MLIIYTIDGYTHLSHCYWPGIAYVVHHVSEFIYQKKKRIYGSSKFYTLYIFRCVIGILFHSFASPSLIFAYFDANWDGDPTNRRYINRLLLFSLNTHSPISWRTKN